MNRFLVLILILQCNVAFSSEEDKSKWFAGPYKGDKSTKSKPTLILLDSGFFFKDSFYSNHEELAQLCALKNKGKIRIDVDGNISVERLKKYSKKLAQCGWDVESYEPIDEDSLF